MTSQMIEAQQPKTALMQMMTGHWVSQALYAAVKLNVPDALGNGPLGIQELAQTIGANTAYLYRLMRALASLGLFKSHPGGAFSLTEQSELLSADHPASLHSFVLMMGEENYKAWSYLHQAVETGESPFELAYGMQAYDYFKKYPEAGENFNTAMAAILRDEAQAIAKAYDFSAFQCLVDVGGGNGMLIASILKAHPGLSGILFELPQVLPEAQTFITAENLSERCKIVGGDFFQDVVSGGDAYILSHIIHTFEDDLCQKILEQIHKVMPKSGKLIIVEEVLEVGDQPASAKTKFMDLNMLALTPGGREHTRQEFEELLSDAAFKLNKVTTIPGGTSILEAVKQ